MAPKSWFLFVLFVSLYFPSGVAGQQAAISTDSLAFHDGHNFDIIGKYHTEKTYGRFPLRYKNTLRDNVWRLGLNSAGISIRFRTDARTIVVRWTVMNDANLAHMPATGVKGVDLYA